MSEYSLVERLRRLVNERPDHVLYRFLTYISERDAWEIQDITASSVWQHALGIARTLKEKKVERGDRVVIFSMQDETTIYSIYGCVLAGVAFTIIPPPIDEGKVERFISVVKSCAPRALISNYRKERSANGGGSLTKRLLSEAFAKTVRMHRIYADRVEPDRNESLIIVPKQEDLIYLQYTSGSTSEPKGVCVTRRNLEKQLEQCDHAGDFNEGRLGSWVPFFHNLGLVVTIFMPAIMRAATVYFLSTTQFLNNPRLWVRMLSEFSLNLTVGPGSAYDACTRLFTPEEAKQYSLSHMTHLMNGSEYISAESVHRFNELFGLRPNAMAPGYGLAENVCLASFCMQDYRELHLDHAAFQDNRIVFSDDADAKPIVSIGTPVRDLTIAVGNPKTGAVYPELKVGEIFIAGDSVAKGYWGEHPANKNFHQRLHGYDMDFYKTGDLGFLYQGHVYLTGRIKEMLIVNGHNIYPSDLHAAIRVRIPALSGSSVGFFSFNDGTKERLIAVIESSSEADFAGLIARINTVIFERFGFSFYDILFVPYNSLPRTDNNKLQMGKTRKLYENGRLPLLYSSRTFRLSNAQHSGNIIERSFDKADEILLQVKSIFEHVLKVEQYSMHDTFLELGGDSLMGFELLTRMEEKFHIKLDLREILQDSSVAGITEYIHGVLSGKRSASKPVNLKEECVLDEGIRVRRPYPAPVEDCRKILLTGGTGFLGAHLIASLIRHYPKDGLEIHCLVRAKSTEHAKQRLIDNMKHYHCWEDSYEPYLYPVMGDFTAAQLGLSDPIYTFLSNRIEIVIQNGAMLNFVFPYEYLKATNVDGTVRTLQFSCDGRPKYYHFISSYSVYDTPDHLGKRVYENDPLKTCKGFSLAYSETKWVSEKLVGIAKRRGLKATIFRPGDIVGSSNGIWEVEDMVSRMIVGAIQMKSIPRTSYCTQMTPVDYVAEAIAYISRRPEAAGECFNVINPKPLSIRELIFHIRRMGYPIQYLPFLIWRKRLKKSSAEDNALAMLECLFEFGSENNPGILRHFTGRNTVYDTSHTDLLLNGTGISCPPVNRKMIAAYLRYFEKLGYIKKM